MPTEPLTDAEIAELRRIQSRAVGSVLREGDQVAKLVLTRDQTAYFLAMSQAVPRALDEVARARALLKRFEWISGAVAWYCPACFGVRGEDGHKVGCELAALIGK